MQKDLSIYSQWVRINLSKIIVAVLLIALFGSGYFYFAGSQSDKLAALSGGLLTSLLAVFIQFLMGWKEHRENDTYKKIGIIKILPNHDGKKDYYYELLKSSTNSIDFLGSTAHSFLRDFGKKDLEAGEKSSALVRAMKKNVKVRILVVQKEHLEQEKHHKFNDAKAMLEDLKKHYPDFFSYSYLSHKLSHTLVTADSECIVGPIIPGVSSDVTPAIHAYTSSPYLKCFLEHFKNECPKTS